MKISKILVTMSSSGDIVIRTSSSLSLVSSADETKILEIDRVKNEIYANYYKGTVVIHSKDQLHSFIMGFFCANDLVSEDTLLTLLKMTNML